jgi:hypothetical protein
MEPLQEAIQIAGGTQAALAAAINKLHPEQEPIGQSAISNWLQRGKVPGERVLDVAIVTEFRVTPHRIRVDLYPHPDDGLPPELRGRSAGAGPDEGRAAA